MPRRKETRTYDDRKASHSVNGYKTSGIRLKDSEWDDLKHVKEKLKLSQPEVMRLGLSIAKERMKGK